jgi:endogenous inhibitor of DNA gyrase (YacG/DUF329 family)
VDLGAWASEQRKIAGDPLGKDDSESESDEERDRQN